MQVIKKFLIVTLLSINVASFFYSLEISLFIIMFTAFLLFSSELIRPVYTGMLVLVLIMIHVPTPHVTVLEGFMSPVLLFMLAIVGVGTAFANSGLGSWFIYALVKLAQKWTLPLPVLLCLSFIPLPLFLPSAIARNAMLHPIMKKFLDHTKNVIVAKKIHLTIGSLNPLGSTAMLTGGLSPIVTAGFLMGFTWGEWFIYMSIPFYSFMFLGLLYLSIRYRTKGDGEKEAYKRFLDDVKKPTFHKEDFKLIMILFIMMAIWLSESWHGMHPSIAAAIGVVCMLLFTRTLVWHDVKHSSVWGNLIIIGSLLSLVSALGYYGIITIITDQMLFLFTFDSNPALMLVMIILCCILFNLIVPNGLVSLIFLLPLFLQLSHQIGIEPVIVAVTVVMVLDGVKFYPSQSIPLLMVYDRKIFTVSDVSQMGVAMTICLIIVLFAVVMPYWSLLGL